MQLLRCLLGRGSSNFDQRLLSHLWVQDRLCPPLRGLQPQQQPQPMQPKPTMTQNLPPQWQLKRLQADLSALERSNPYQEHLLSRWIL